MAISGIFYGATGNAWIKPRIQWFAQADIGGNYSDVTATLSYTRTNTGFTTSGHWAGSLTINGDSKSVSGVYVQITNGGYTATVSHTVRVYHADDGTRTIHISAGGGIADTTLTYTVIGADVTLEEIPRAASIAATDADIGAVSMVSIGKRSDLYTHTVAYRFGDMAGYLTGSGLSDTPVRLTQVSIPFSLPEEFYYEIPDAPTGQCSLICTTYHDDSVVGSPQQTAFTVRAAPGQCAPLLTAEAADTEPVTLALTGDGGSFVRYASRVLCTLGCEGRFGAAITEKKIAGISVTEDQLLLENIDTGTVRFSVRDSRGYITEQTLEAALIGYFFPTGRMNAARTDATSGNVDIQAQGSWFSGSFGQQSNTLQARCQVNSGDWQALEARTDGDSYTVEGRLSGLTYTDAHTITLELSDCIGTLILSARVNPGIPVFDWGKEDFRFNVPVAAEKVTGLAAPEADTDAANKQYVDTGVQAARAVADTKVSMTLLWENASPASAFAAQTIALDLSGYDCVQVEFEESWQTITSRINVGKNGGVDQIGDIYRDVTGYFYAAHRDISVTTTGVSFGDRLYKYANGQSYGVANQALIPYRIYGIKGVQA